MASVMFTLFGKNLRMGSYLLIIHLSKPAELAFGRFQKGKLFSLPQGDYLYIGSALGGRTNNAPLARRVIRHTSRTGNKPHHRIRETTKNLFSEKKVTGNKEITLSAKKLRWHIDYLLDLPEAEITHIVIIGSPLRIEHKLSALLGSLDETSPVAHRLGAQDTKNSTHILKLNSQERILEVLHVQVTAMIAEH